MRKNANRPDADNPEWTRKEIREARPLLNALSGGTAAAVSGPDRPGAQRAKKKRKAARPAREDSNAAASIASEIRSALLGSR